MIKVGYGIIHSPNVYSEDISLVVGGCKELGDGVSHAVTGENYFQHYFVHVEEHLKGEKLCSEDALHLLCVGLSIDLPPVL